MSQATMTARRTTLAKQDQARLILTGTAGVICSVMVLWLLVTSWIKAPVMDGPIWSLALPAPDGLGGPVAFPEADARLLSGDGGGGAGGAAESGKARLERELGGFLDRRKGRPVILYLEAACASWGDGAEVRPYLLTSGESMGEAMAKVPLEDLIALLKSRGKTSSKLLLLDAGQVGPDREMGLFGADLPPRIKELIGNDTSLAVLLACGPGQKSWVAESEGCSAFAYYLAEALDGRIGNFGGVTAGALRDYVAPRVARWVAQNRGNAVQVPVLVGDPGLRLALPGRSLGGRGKPRAPEPDKKLRDKFLGEWAERQRLASHVPTPVRHAPIAWRRYQTELLRAERLLRAGSPEAALALETAISQRAKVEQQSSGPAVARPWSLALARAARYPDLRVEPDAYEQDVNRLLNGLAKPPNPVAAAPKVQAPQAPARADAKQDAPKPDAKGAEPKAKDAAKAKDVAKAGAKGAEPKGKGAAKAPPDVKALAVPVEKAADADPLEALTEGAGDSGGPVYVEGQVPVWYAEFVNQGGETPALREERIKAVGQAFAIRKLVEAACWDARVAPWVRPVLDRADPARRNAQDLLFSGDQVGLTRAKAALNEAEDLAKEAFGVAESVRSALDLLERLQDELPYYGDWLSRRRLAMDRAYLEILEDAGKLADQVAATPSSTAGPSAPDRTGQELATAAAKLARVYGNFRESADQVAAKLATSDDWREVDAILYLPMLDPKARGALLERVGTRALTPSLDTDSDAGDLPDSQPDPAFWNQAVGLAWVEASLLKIAGVDDTTLWSQALQARSNWEKNQDAALSAMAVIAGRARADRERLLADIRGRDEGRSRADDEASRVRAADLAARVLPVAELRRLDDDPCRAREERDLRDLILWQGVRLCDDFAGRAARLLLTDVRPAGLPPAEATALREAIALAGARDAARLTLTAGKSASAEAQVDRAGSLPRGLATAFVPQFPDGPGVGVTVRANTDPNLPGPTFLNVPDPQPTTLAYERADGRVTGRQKPVVFYRGRFFGIRDDASSGKAEELVKVKITQRYLSATLPWTGGKKRTFKIPDQFERNRGRGFLHPVNTLDYALKVTNTSDRELRLFVSHGLEGIAPFNDRITVGAGLTQDVFGAVSPADLPDDPEVAKDLTVKITEEDASGRRLAKDLVVPFRKVHPGPVDIGTAVAFNNGVLSLEVTHSKDDRVTAPALVHIIIEPLEAVRQIDSSPVIVPLGETVRYRYLIDRSQPKITWTLTIDEVKVKTETMIINHPAAVAPVLP